MNDYVEVRVGLTPCSEVMTDVLAALLADAGFESFVPDDSGLTAYIKKEDYTDSLRSVVAQMPFECDFSWTSDVVEGRDWNHEWEQNYFKPIVVADKCVIHSTFHTDVPVCDYDIVIDPKMAFGTGHHSTTWLIISRLLDMDLDGKNVIDMGTGTGILAILAAMRGARHVAGIEIDEAAYENALENRTLNGFPELQLIRGDASALNQVEFKADLLLANINRNVIVADIPRYTDALSAGGHMLLSGFYTSDIPVVTEAAHGCGLDVLGYTERSEWACLHLTKA